MLTTQQEFLSFFDKVARQVEKGKEIPEISLNNKISSLGIDSVSMMEIIGVIEDELNFSLPDEQLARLQTVEDVWNLVQKQTHAKSKPL